MTVLAASNDLGVTGPTTTGGDYTHRVVYWPASDPLVTAVGGTKLHLDAAGRRTSPDTAWNDSHSLAGLQLRPHGRSVSQRWRCVKAIWRPGYQDAVRRDRGKPSWRSRHFHDRLVHRRRADLRVIPRTRSSYRGSPGWIITGGTSAATPEFAGIVAIADQYAQATPGAPQSSALPAGARTRQRNRRRHQGQQHGDLHGGGPKARPSG